MIKMIATVIARSTANIPPNPKYTDVFAVIGKPSVDEESALLSFTEELEKAIALVREKRGSSNYGKCGIEFTAIEYTPLWIHVDEISAHPEYSTPAK